MNRIKRLNRADRQEAEAGMRRWALLGGVLGLLMALVLFAPARWLAAGVAHFSNGQVQLNHALGSVWNGSAQLVLTGGRDSRSATSLPGRLHWKLRPAWSGARLQLLPDCCTSEPLQLTVKVGWQRFGLQVEDHRSQWPTSLLQGLGTPWNTLRLDGSLNLTFRSYAVQWVQGRLQMQGTVEVGLHNAISSLTTLRPMGSYRLIMQGADQLLFSLVTDAGPLMLSGQGQVTGQRLRFKGEASAAPEHLPALNNLLSLLGQRQGSKAILSL